MSNPSQVTLSSTDNKQHRIPGYFTAQGSQRFAERAIRSQGISESHFRKANNGTETLTFSSLGMGTYLGNTDASDDALMIAAVEESVLSGAVNVIDTAINYRAQKSERSIGKALQHLISSKSINRDELFIASKNGFLTPDADFLEANPNEDFRSYFTKTFIDSGIIKPQDIANGSHCMSPSYLQHQLQQSLDNLGLETLDLMYLHNAAESQIPAVGKEVFLARLLEAFKFYEQARQENKIRYYGMATWNCFRAETDDEDYLSLAEVVGIAEKAGGKNHGFRFIQLPFNLGMTEALTLNSQPVFEGTSSLLEAASAFEIGVFTSVPLLQGQLLNHRMPKFDGVKTPAQACLQFVRSVPGIVAPLVGHKQKQHTADNLALAKVAPVDFDTLQYLLQQFI